MKQISFPVLRKQQGKFVHYYGLMRAADLLERASTVSQLETIQWRHQFAEWCYEKQLIGKNAPFAWPFTPGPGTPILAHLAGDIGYASIYLDDEGDDRPDALDRMGVLTCEGGAEERWVCYDNSLLITQIREELAAETGQEIGPDSMILVVFFDGRMKEKANGE